MIEENLEEILKQQESLIYWMNNSFSCFGEEPLTSLSKLNSPQLVFKILNEM